VVLVTESTPFGLADLRLAVGAVRELRLPFGVVINRAGVGDGRVYDYCASERIPLFLEIPNDRRVAECYSRGQTIIDGVPELGPLFEVLCRAIADHCEGLRTGAEDVAALTLERSLRVGQR
jgi:MinD superfamily P-loop ATPase